MIIKGKSSRSYKSLWSIGISLLLISVLYFKFFNATDLEVKFEGEKYYCDFESIDGADFITDGIKFTQAKTQSNEHVLSGSYSSKIEGASNYGPTFILNNPTPGKNYLASVWTLRPHKIEEIKLIASASDSDDFFISTDKRVRRNGDFWNLRELRFKVPEKNTPKEIKVYIYKSAGENALFIDEFKVEEINPKTGLSESKSFEFKTLNLIIDKEAESYFDKMRKKSIERGLIVNDGTKAKGKILEGDEYKEIEFRLKGDWLDHISGNLSYRIDMDSETSWQGMQSFSIQEPKTRGFLREWVYFKFLDYADVLHPRYDFILFKKNNDKSIVFSYEEHFTKNLVEHLNRREGPIMKLTEDRMWEITERYIKQKNGALPASDKKDEAYWQSEIRSFKEGKIKKNPNLLKNFESAQSLMHQYKYNSKPVDQIFDVERLAKYMALTDICLAHHAITWHNQRFYYNPVTALLEPIGFDAYTPEDPSSYATKIMSKAFYLYNTKPYEPLHELFYDDTFAKQYFYYLNKYSDPQLIQNILNDIEEDIVEREQFINNRYPKYKYNREEILQKATAIQIALPGLENSLQAFASKESDEDGNIKLNLSNIHSFPISIENGNQNIIVYPKNIYEPAEYTQITVPKNTKYLDYKILGRDSLHRTEITSWSVPESTTPRQELRPSNLALYTDIVDTFENNVVFKKGKHIIDKPFVIDKQKYVTINSGTEISFRDQGCLISYSPIKAIGDPEDPIKINCTDGISGSLTVLQADSKSILRHIEFNNQNTLSQDQWILTGGVTFYESDVDLSNVAFRNNKCEDALNIIRSEFKLDNCLFHGTFGDAFDADFCNGEILNCYYINSGNDAIDVSGSQINIKRTTIETANDKGVSAGENSRVIVSDSEIKLANIGVASKDLSELILTNVTISDCNTGMTAFQKKPEFGPAQISSTNSKLSNITKEFMIEEKSILEIK